MPRTRSSGRNGVSHGLAKGLAAEAEGSSDQTLRRRRSIRIELPEFLIRALENRVAEANEGAPSDERSTLGDYIESELFALITLREAAVLEIRYPGFGKAVSDWLDQMR